MAVRLEEALSGLRGANRQPKIIEPYAGYATPEHLVVRGRVHDSFAPAAPRPGQGRFTNLRQMLAMFRTQEVAGATVTAGAQEAMTDEEGYFTLQLERPSVAGWHDVELTLEANGSTATCPVLVPNPRTSAIVISDIDDTVMKTGAYSLLRNLWTTFTGSALTRQVYPDAAVLLHELAARGERPVYYVSSSPWNLYAFLRSVFERASVVQGPMFLRDMGLSETKLITDGHGDHKGQSIDTILAATPDCSVVLMGDTGQKDALIYRDVIERHPGRVKAVVLRAPGPGLDDDDRRAIAALEETGVLVLHGRSFAGFAGRIEEALAPDRSQEKQ
ncbi:MULTISPECIES: App1 family protein [unclassified Roseovarius]|uniref:App1 family protein n=1 Tax=unclassified Roseovarius TaxID=2614913 RepID=UPI00273D302D|nr:MULTISPECIES: phosphatase domain-containing protein [unclassified Roseovarius]